MSVAHNGKHIARMNHAPVDPDGTDWVYFSYGDWLRSDESIDSSSALCTGGTIEAGPTYLGTTTDQDGVSHPETYGIQFSVSSGATLVTITHRKTTSTSGSPSLARIDIDHSVSIPVRTL